MLETLMLCADKESQVTVTAEHGHCRLPRPSQFGLFNTWLLFSERKLTFKFAICCRPSVCRLSVVCR